MKRKLNTLLVVVAALSLSSTSAVSQINSYAVDQVVTLTSGPYTIDVDGDGNDDYTFEILPLSASLNAARVIALGSAQVMDGSTFGYPDALNFGDAVSGPYSSGNAVLGTDVGGGGLFSGAGMKYLGLNFVVAGGNHLGWMSMEVAGTNDTIVLYDLGYNLNAGEGITAGQTVTIGTQEPNLTGISIYPNPCESHLRIDWHNSNKPLSYAIFTLTGELVSNGSTSTQIDVALLAPGVYIFTCTDGASIGRATFMKK
jgi:hypothetical protein